MIRETIRAASGQLPLERELFHLYTLKGGRVVRVEFFRTRPEALQAASAAE